MGKGIGSQLPATKSTMNPRNSLTLQSFSEKAVNFRSNFIDPDLAKPQSSGSNLDSRDLLFHDGIVHTLFHFYSVQFSMADVNFD